MCWDDTPAATYASQNCPNYFVDFDPTGCDLIFSSKSGEEDTNSLYLVAVFLFSEKATKYCGEDGQWFRHPDTNRTWSNYTLCNENTKAKLKVFHSSSMIEWYYLSIYHCFKVH